jgi:hypothetical protein
MENSLSPAFVKIDYTSAYAPHVMTIPSVPLIAAVGEAPPYFDLRGAEIDVNVDTAINDFVDLLAELFVGTTKFNSYTVYSQPGVGDIPVPVWSASLAQSGLAGSTAPAKAMQQTFTFRATDFTLYKLVLLDAPTPLGLDRVTSLASFPAYTAVKNYVVAPETWIASRGGGRPQTFLQISTTLNEKLRRSYKMN